MAQANHVHSHYLPFGVIASDVQKRKCQCHIFFFFCFVCLHYFSYFGLMFYKENFNVTVSFLLPTFALLLQFLSDAPNRTLISHLFISYACIITSIVECHSK